MKCTQVITKKYVFYIFLWIMFSLDYSDQLEVKVKLNLDSVRTNLKKLKSHVEVRLFDTVKKISTCNVFLS